MGKEVKKGENGSITSGLNVMPEKRKEEGE